MSTLEVPASAPTYHCAFALWAPNNNKTITIVFMEDSTERRNKPRLRQAQRLRLCGPVSPVQSPTEPLRLRLPHRGQADKNGYFTDSNQARPAYYRVDAPSHETAPCPAVLSCCCLCLHSGTQQGSRASRNDANSGL